MIELCGVAPERVVTVPYGVTDAFTPGPPEAVAAFRRQKGLPEPFILFLGTLEPRKNIGRLIEAYAALRERTPGTRFQNSSSRAAKAGSTKACSQT